MISISTNSTWWQAETAGAFLSTLRTVQLHPGQDSLKHAHHAAQDSIILLLSTLWQQDMLWVLNMLWWRDALWALDVLHLSSGMRKWWTSRLWVHPLRVLTPVSVQTPVHRRLNHCQAQLQGDFSVVGNSETLQTHSIPFDIHLS